MTRKPRRARTIGSTRPAEAPAANDFEHDYAYVRADLRRIAALAVGFLAALAVLAVVLR